MNRFHKVATLTFWATLGLVVAGGLVRQRVPASAAPTGRLVGVAGYRRWNSQTFPPKWMPRASHTTWTGSIASNT